MQFKRITGLSIVAAATTVAVLSGQAQDPAAKAAAILAESRKAIGGDDKLAAIKTLEIKGTARRNATDMNLEGDMTIVMELPGKYLRKEAIFLGNAGIDIVEGLNGTESWEEQKFSGNMNFGDDGGGNRGRGGFPGQAATATAATNPEAAAAIKQAQLAARQTEMARVLLAVLLTSDRPMKYLGQVASPNATAEAIEMTAPDGTPIRILVDSKNYMPLMLTWTGIAQDPIAALAARSGWRGRGRGNRGNTGGGGRQGQQSAATAAAEAARADALTQPTALQMYLSEYKAVNGVKLPHLIVRGARDQVTEEWVIKSYKLNPTLKADTFKQ